MPTRLHLRDDGHSAPLGPAAGCGPTANAPGTVASSSRPPSSGASSSPSAMAWTCHDIVIQVSYQEFIFVVCLHLLIYFSSLSLSLSKCCIWMFQKLSRICITSAVGVLGGSSVAISSTGGPRDPARGEINRSAVSVLSIRLKCRQPPRQCTFSLRVLQRV